MIEFYPVDSLYKENFKIITLDSGVEVISFKETLNGNYITSVYSNYSDITSDVNPTVSFSFNISGSFQLSSLKNWSYPMIKLILFSFF